MARRIPTPWESAGRVVLSFAALLALMGVALPAAAYPASPTSSTSSSSGAAGATPTQTVVSLTFDDGRRTQYTEARPVLASHGMQGTLFLNSGSIDLHYACCMTWPEAQAIDADGNEIGGHTYDHKDLTDPKMTYDQAVYQVCHDRDTLISKGFDPTSFAYPKGAYARTWTVSGQTKSVEDVVRECGYTSGRATGGVSAGGPTYAETIPPVDPYATRTPSGVCTDPTICEVLTAKKLQDQVSAAATHGGGWLQLVFHEVCQDADTTCLGTTWRPITRSEFNSFLDWLAAAGQEGGAPPGTVVLTVDRVIRGDIPDILPPTTTISCDGSACASGWYNGPVTVELAATDDRSGVAETRYTTDGTVPDPTSPIYEGPFTVSTSTTVQFRSWDVAGNAEPANSQSIQIDTVPPSTTISCDGSECSSEEYGSPVTVSLSASDDSSGVAVTRYTTDGTDPGPSSPAYTDPFVVSSTKTVMFRSWDQAGNAEPTNTQLIRVPVPDTTAPTTTISCNGSACSAPWHAAPVTVSLAATDDGSGVAVTRYTTDGTDPGPSSQAYTVPFGLSSTATVKFRSWDKAGNVEPTKSQLIQVDATAPTVSMTSPKDGAKVRGTVHVAAKASDGQSGVASVSFYADGVLIGSASGSQSQYRIDWDTRGVANGNHQLYAVATDGAGKQTTSASITVKVSN